MDRREFINLGTGAAIAGTAVADAGAATGASSTSSARRGRGQRTRRPNVLWIQTDEHRPGSLGCYGSAWAKTPNIDALAARGVVMKTTVCQSPVCDPSRASQLSALYPQEVPHTMVEPVKDPRSFPAEHVTFPEVLAQAGYETVSFGKAHTPPHHIWQVKKDDPARLVVDTKYAHYLNLGPGYDEAAYHVVRRPGIHRILIGGTYPTFFGNPSRQLTDMALQYLHDRSGDRPFLLRVSHNWPHSPVLPPPPFDRLYEADEIPIQYYDVRAYRGRAQYDRTMSDAQRMAELTHEEYRQCWKDYMGLVGYVDYEVGRLMAGLEALGLLENTIVLFSSDHGRALGEYGHGEKCTFDDQVWRVPFIWHWPGHLPEGVVREDLCELIDTGRTLAGLVGLESAVPAHWRGRDLFGSPARAPEQQAVFGQIGVPNLNAPILQTPLVEAERKNIYRLIGRPREEVNPAFVLLRMGVRTPQYRMDLSWMSNGRRIPLERADGNLFDLRADPQEMKNLWTDPAARPVIDDLNRRLETWFASMDKPKILFG